MGFDELAIESVKTAYRAYVLDNNPTLFKDGLVDKNAPIVLFQSRWLGDCEIISESYTVISSVGDTCVVQGKIDYWNKQHDSFTERNTIATVVCVKTDEGIKYASVHNSGVKKRVINKEGYIDKDEYYRTIIEQLCDVLMEIDIDNNEMKYDEVKYRQFFGDAPRFNNMDEWFWHVCNNFLDKQDAEKLDLFRQADVDKRLKNNDFIFDTEFRIKKQGEAIWVHLRIVFIPDADMIAPSKIFILMDDITLEMDEKMQNIEYARRDSLTQLWNRRYTEELIASAIKDNGKGIFMIVDVDKFKDINDTYGHITGDEILKLVSSNMQSYLREGEILGRMGGDEFILYLFNTGDYDADVKHINEVVSSTRFFYTEEGIDKNIHCSAGAVFFEDDSIAYETLYNEADKVMYDAKEGGRDAVNIIRI